MHLNRSASESEQVSRKGRSVNLRLLRQRARKELETIYQNGILGREAVVALHRAYELQQLKQPTATDEIFLQTFHHIRRRNGISRDSLSEILPSERRAEKSLSRRLGMPDNGNGHRPYSNERQALFKHGGPRVFDKISLTDEQLRLLGPQLLPELIRPLVKREILVPAARHGGDYVFLHPSRKPPESIAFYRIPRQLLGVVRNFLESHEHENGFVVK